RLRFGLIALAGDPDEGLVAGHQRLERLHDLCAPPLLPAMVGLGLLYAGRAGVIETLPGAPDPVPAVSLERKQIVAASFDDGIGQSPVAVERIRGDHSASKINELDNLEGRLDLVLPGTGRHRRQA